MKEKNMLGNILISERNKRKLSLRDFSKLLGISHTYLSKLEKGVDTKTGLNHVPTMNTLIKISEGLNISVDEFLKNCGYINLDEYETQNFQLDESSLTIDLETYFNDFINKILKAKKVKINNTKITTQDVIILCNNMNLEFEKIIKKYN